MTTGFYLIDHENKYAPRRSNGKRGWYYPLRSKCAHNVRSVPHLLVLHTTEQLPDYDGVDEGAEKVAKYAASTGRAVSWHMSVDSDSIVPMLPVNYTGFHVRDFNRCGYGIEMATKASAWASSSEAWVARIIANLAAVIEQIMSASGREWRLDRPLTLAEAKAGMFGYVAHAVLDPSRRSDPGPDFPWGLLAEMLGGPATSTKEDDMPTLVKVQGDNTIWNFTGTHLEGVPGDAFRDAGWDKFPIKEVTTSSPLAKLPRLLKEDFANIGSGGDHDHTGLVTSSEFAAHRHDEGRTSPPQ